MLTRTSVVFSQKKSVTRKNHLQKRCAGGEYPNTAFDPVFIPKNNYWTKDLNEHPMWLRIIGSVVTPGFVKKYTAAMRYREYGLKLEDLLIETADVALACSRLPKEVLSDRDDRMKQALVASASQKPLPADMQMTEEEDTPYLAPYLQEVVRERMIRENFRKTDFTLDF
eukprot:TRINITY_DN106_c0_g1_i2.p1 TRINITY_DN106_c0_g1~~TRINITY_DN106_c0_g1_i2.p1  ORF type:complete len:169 (-),score=52.92 TRINITY_DN106_c0_g1_i2:40-546(-)